VEITESELLSLRGARLARLRSRAECSLYQFYARVSRANRIKNLRRVDSRLSSNLRQILYLTRDSFVTPETD